MDPLTLRGVHSVTGHFRASKREGVGGGPRPDGLPLPSMGGGGRGEDPAACGALTTRPVIQRQVRTPTTTEKAREGTSSCSCRSAAARVRRARREVEKALSPAGAAHPLCRPSRPTPLGAKRSGGEWRCRCGVRLTGGAAGGVCPLAAPHTACAARTRHRLPNPCPPAPPAPVPPQFFLLPVCLPGSVTTACARALPQPKSRLRPVADTKA